MAGLGKSDEEDRPASCDTGPHLLCSGPKSDGVIVDGTPARGTCALGCRRDWIYGCPGLV